MTDEDNNFINISKIEEFQMKDLSSASIAYSYPFLAIATSPVEVITFNFETKVTTYLKRKSKPLDPAAVPLCLAISDDKTLIAAGYSDYNGGEIVLWSFKGNCDIFSFRMPEGISKIQFGLTHDHIFHSNPMGIITLSTISKFFKMSVSNQQFCDFESPIIAMAIHHKYLYVSSSSHTSCFNLEHTTNNVVWSKQEETNCFAFYDPPDQTNHYVARGVQHDVIVSTPDGKDVLSYEFSKSPNAISFIDLNTILILFSGQCEMIRDNNQYHRKVPPGTALALSDRIFIAGASLWQLSLISVEQRVELYLKKGNWSKLFDQITNKRDYSDLDGLFLKYIDYEEFDPNYLFKTVERLDRTDFITEMKFMKGKQIAKEENREITISDMSKKDLLIFSSFIDSGIKHWFLSSQFVCCIIIAESKEEEELLQFLTSVELNFSWLPNIFKVCIKQNKLTFLSKLSLSYSIDYYLNLVINHYQDNFKEIHELMDKLLITQKLSPQSAISYFLTVDLTDFIRYDIEHSARVIQSALEFILAQSIDPSNLPEDFSTLINKVIHYIDKDEDQIWVVLMPLIKINKITIDKELIPQAENFIYASNTGDKIVRGELLVYLLSTSQITDIQRALNLARNSHLDDCELDIIILIHDIDEYFSYIVDNHKQTFRDGLYEVLNGDKKELESIYLSKCQILIAINPDEFCQEIINMNSIELIHTIYKNLQKNKTLLWHFMKRTFSDSTVINSSTDEEIVSYISFLADYKPDDVYSALKSVNNFPLDKILKICQEHGIVDATLYLFGLLRDIDGTLRFGKEALLTSLMENQSSRVVFQVCDYLSSSSSPFKSSQEDQTNIWFEYLSSFQVPIFTYFYYTTEEQKKNKYKFEKKDVNDNDNEQNEEKSENQQKLDSIIDLLVKFLDSMVRNIDDSKSIIDKFIELFAFLPFKVARPIVTKIFHSIREKNLFSGTLVQILKNEAVQVQMERMAEMAKGVEYDGVRCGFCGKLLGQSDVVALHCGHVFHDKCAKSGWCKICDASTESQKSDSEAIVIDVPNKLITMDQLMTDDLPVIDAFHQKNSNLPSQEKIEKPKIGIVNTF